MDGKVHECEVGRSVAEFPFESHGVNKQLELCPRCFILNWIRVPKPYSETVVDEATEEM